MGCCEHITPPSGSPRAGRVGAALFLPAVLALALLAGLGAAAQPARWPAEAWRKDLRVLRQVVRVAHQNPFHTADSQALEAAFDDLHARIPALTDFEIAFGMHRIMASLGDGHSWLTYYGRDLSRYFPFDAWEFSDGLYLTHAAAGHDRAAGARVRAIDGVPLEEVRERLRPWISRDNEMEVLRQIPLMLRQPLVLHAAGITRERDRAEFTLSGSDGRTFKETFRGRDFAAYKMWREGQRTAPEQVRHMGRRTEYYWYETLAADNAIYFQFNWFDDMPGKPFEAFLEGLFADLDSRPDACLILDVRHNVGGRIALVDPLLEQIRRRPGLAGGGRLYAITGRATFSSALMLVARLERHTGVVLAGEPGSGKPNSYGQYTPFKLPETGLEGSISTHFHQEGEALDTRDRIEVQLEAAPSFADYQAGRDPALEAVLDHWRAARESATP